MASAAIRPFRVAIIGGGLGGLALANGLLQRGLDIECRIFERDAREGGYRPQGYRIGLNPDGLQALDRCGITTDELVRGGVLDQQALTGVCIVDAISLKTILSFPAPGGGIVNRWRLHERLQDRVASWIQHDKSFVGFEQRHPDAITARFADGTEYEADLLVGADGVNSRVRAQLVPDLQLIDSAVTGLAAPVPRSLAEQLQLTTLLARTKGNLVRFLGPDSFTWLMFEYTEEQSGEPFLIWVLNHHVGHVGFDYPETATPDEWHRYACGVAEHTHPQLAQLIRATPIQNILKPRHQYYLPSDAVRRDPYSAAARQAPRVAVLGDAAHAMTTHRGSGANTAFRDAADLADAIGQLADDHARQLPWNPARLAAYHHICATRGATMIAESLSATHSMHQPSRLIRFGYWLFMRLAHFIIQLVLFVRRLFRRH
jgi:2-polyprenyl-6-methoxyphenol hydroxylase-like FAD-dependent oxidoreductase